MCKPDRFDNTKGYRNIFAIGSLSQLSACNSFSQVHALLGGKSRRKPMRKSNRTESKKRAQNKKRKSNKLNR